MKLLDIEQEQPPSLLPPAPPVEQGTLRRRIGIGLVVLWLLSAIYIVGADQQAVVTRFGRVVEPRVTPGIHLSLPWPIDQVTRLKVQQLQRQVIGGSPSDLVVGRLQPLLSQFLTGDQNIIHLRVVVQYSVSVPSEYLFQAQDISRLITATSEAELSRRIASRTVDAVLTTEKAAIQEEVRAASQKILNDYKAGVLLASVSIESAVPPPEAADAFRDVASARADSARIVNESQGFANDVIPKARGQAQQMLESAAAYRERKINESLGDASRFTQVAAEYAKASEVNGRRLYMETLEQVLPRIRKLIVDKSGNIDLTIIRRGEAPASAVQQEKK
jgi:membrane protease subunit HflK